MGVLREQVQQGRWTTKYYVDELGDIKSKECRQCGEVKELDNFYRKADCLAGRRSTCKDCELSDNRRYHKENLPQMAARKRKWRRENWELSRRTIRTWYHANRDEINKKRRIKGTEYSARRRHQIRNLPHDWGDVERQQVLSYFGGCALTGKSEDIVFDHVIPVSAGHGGTFLGNMLPMTSFLNTSKATRNIFSWFSEVKDMFELDEERFWKAITYLAEQCEMSVDDYINYVNWCHENKREEF